MLLNPRDLKTPPFILNPTKVSAGVRKVLPGARNLVVHKLTVPQKTAPAQM